MSPKPASPLLFRLACLAALVSLALIAKAQAAEIRPTTHTLTSRDGTRIAYDKWDGGGPALVIVGGALSERSGGAELARLLAARFTVYCYDRRGRGDSTDTRPYAVQREIDDLDALIDLAGGSALVYGKSSGAALALQAAAALGPKITRLALYEPPYSESEGAAAQWRVFTAKTQELLAAGRNTDAITGFLRFVGAPDEMIAKMKTSPAWPGMVDMAPTLAYDNALLGEDRAVPVTAAYRIKALTLVLDGGASAGPMPFMRATADKIAKAIPGAQRRTVEGQAHDVSAKALAPILLKFFA